MLWLGVYSYFGDIWWYSQEQQQLYIILFQIYLSLSIDVEVCFPLFVFRSNFKRIYIWIPVVFPSQTYGGNFPGQIKNTYTWIKPVQWQKELFDLTVLWDPLFARQP